MNRESRKAGKECRDRPIAHHWRARILICAALLPALVALWMMVSHWVAVPWWDEWKTPGEQIASWYRGTLTFRELCSQHNESRKLFPRLVYLPVAIVAGWDVRYFMGLTFALVAAGSTLLWKLIRRSAASRSVAIATFAVMNCWLFWPRQYENFLFGLQGELFVPAFALAGACLINLSARPLWQKALANAALAHISTYTVANGMLIWLLAFPLEASTSPRQLQYARRASLFSRVGYCLAAIASIGCYFHGYQHPALSPPMVLTLRRTPELAAFFARWLGDIALTRAPLLAGAAVAVLFLALAGFALKLSRASGRWRLHYPWLLLGLYTLISGGITSAGRLGFGQVAAAHFRYAPFTAFLYIAIAGLAASVDRELVATTAARRSWRIGCAIAAGVIALQGISAFRQERPILAATKAQRQMLSATLRWSEAIPRNPNLALLSPYEKTPATIDTLAQHDTLRPRLVSSELKRIVSEPPSNGVPAAGLLRSVARGGETGAIHFEGAACIPETGAAAACVVIGFARGGRWQPLTVAPSHPPDGAFSLYLEPTDGLRADDTFRAWAVDLNAGRAYPMAGALRAHATPPP